VLSAGTRVGLVVADLSRLPCLTVLGEKPLQYPEPEFPYQWERNNDANDLEDLTDCEDWLVNT